MIDRLKEHRYKIAVVVSLSILAFSFLVVLTYSKFHATFATDDSARVAFFLGDRFKTVNLLDEEIAPGETKEIPIEVSNWEGMQRIETSMRYIINLEEMGSLPLTYTLTKSNQSIDFTSKQVEGTMSVGSAQTENYLLKISWPEDFKDASHANELKAVRLKLQAEQID